MHGPATDDAARIDLDDATSRQLQWGNAALALLHLAQAAAVLVLAGDFAISVTSAFPTGPPGSVPPAPSTLVEVPVGASIAVFFGLAALDHGLTAGPARAVYERQLRRGINTFRWLEYSLSATVMILLIAAYSGITEVTALVGIAGANVAMILFGWLQERANPPDRATTTMLPFWFGTVAGAAPWLAITTNLVGAETVPGFVYGIFASQLVFFSGFAVNQWLQYRGIGPWRRYLFGEKAYLALSLGAKSILAWQIFGGSLAG